MNAKMAEENLERLLKKLSLKKAVTVADIKDIIWNETDKSGSSQLFFRLIENETDQAIINEAMRAANDAWNYFPHRTLGGKAPFDVLQEHQLTGKIDESSQKLLPKKGKSLQEVFAGDYPEKVVFEKISNDTWGFSFPKLYYDLIDRLGELEESGMPVKELEKELYSMIRQMPELFDAVNTLAHLHGRKREFGIAKRLYEEAIKTARRHIPEKFKHGEDRVIWAYLDNRPFLRLLSEYAQFVEQFEGIRKAIPLYEEILSFNPNDNQGIRAILATVYLKTAQPDKVIDLALHYPDDSMPDLIMGNLLALIQLNEFEQAKKLLHEHEDYQKHIIKELLKPVHPKPPILIEGRVKRGGEDEAYYYWQTQGKLWQETKGALEFLAQHSQDIQPPIINSQVLRVDFFSDFLLFLKLLNERPIKRTATGKISIKDVESFLPTLKTVRPILEDMNKMKWKVRTEDDVMPLNLLNILAKLMHLTRKSGSKLLLTKNGKEFLEKLSPVDQYKQFVSYYWQRFNWGYLASGWTTQNTVKIAEEFQAQQTWIWRILAAQGDKWVDYSAFCEILHEELHLDPFLEEKFSTPEKILDSRVYSLLFTKNLSLLGCIEVETKQKDKWTTDILRFRSTPLGLMMYENG